MKTLLRMLLRSGFCADTVPALRFCLWGLRVPGLRHLVIASRLKFTPDILGKLREAELPAAQRSRLFSEAMNLFRSGPTFKTTAAGRTPLTDAAILAKAGPRGSILEVGVSDGVSALGLLEARGGAGVRLSDRQASFHYADFGPFRIFYDREDGLRSVKFLFLYLCFRAGAAAAPAGAAEVSLLNPAVQERFPKVRLEVFDIFEHRLAEPADLIKCANVLNKAYFSAAESRRALANLLHSLQDGGWLFISQSNPKYAGGEAYVALRREGDLLILKEEAHEHELLPDLRSELFTGLVAPEGKR